MNWVWDVGHGSWTGSDDKESLNSLHRSVELGVNFSILRGCMEMGEARASLVNF